MKNLIRKWILHLKRKRYHRHLREGGNYKTLENSIKETGSLCSNCNAPLTGPFCHICGQKDDDLKRPIWTLIREILDDVISTDSRLFKTLILLVLVPGGLTRAFRDGRRARFVPPLRLYLVISILFFVILKVADILILDIHVTPIDRPDVVEAPADVAPPEGQTPEVASSGLAESDLASTTEGGTAAQDTKPIAKEGLSKEDLEAIKSPDLTPEEKVRLVLGDEGFERLPEETKQAIREAKDGKNVKIDGDDLIRSLMGGGDPGGAGGDVRIDTDWPYDVEIAMFVKNSNDPREGLKQEDIDEILNDPENPAFLKRATRGFSEALQDPEAFNELFNDWLPPALFVLMPIFAFILRVFHWGKDRVYLQQFVFSLHFHTFLFLLMTAMTVIVPTYGGDLSITIFWWVTSIYLIIALKIGQGQGWLKAFFKAGPIWVSYFAVMMLVMFFIVFAGLGDIDVFDLLMGDTSAFETEA
ncbi:DUF3667 domain-containing protein [Kordiimonas lacus]|uniref:DUF3667 domain-containing protein n=1 Tax=Kordiimonas lacus TaxID=637679 RepID=A0A1G7DF06_9PROT|nr:DUF3667 domain-containing protein [Kordiimonas lacus]SDE49395.1 Protein of unknown function [Kordiimonas lacus]